MHGKDLIIGTLVPKRTSEEPLVGGFGCYELVLFGIRVLAEQILGKVLDIKVDHTGQITSALAV